MEFDDYSPRDFAHFTRGYTSGWHAAIDAIRKELAKPDRADGLLDQALDKLRREHGPVYRYKPRGPAWAHA
jgi:hypothetical protein